MNVLTFLTSLQWRGLAIAVIVVVDVIFFSLVYTILDRQTVNSTKHPESTLPWLECMVIKQDKNQCLALAEPLGVNENLLIAVLIMLAVVGIEAFLLICRVQMITGWFKLFQRKFRHSREMQEFVSLEAHRFSTNKQQIELLNMPSANASKSALDSPLSPGMSPSISSPAKFVSPLTRIENTNYREDFLQQENVERVYHNPATSFSRPRAPSVRYSDSSNISETPTALSAHSKAGLVRQPTLPRIDD